MRFSGISIVEELSFVRYLNIPFPVVHVPAVGCILPRALNLRCHFRVNVPTLLQCSRQLDSVLHHVTT